MEFQDRIKLKKLLRNINGKDIDIFKNINFDNNLNRIQLVSKGVQVRISRCVYQNHHSNINLLINFKAVKKIAYIQCLIKRIELAKKIFIMDIEEGSEVYIPNDLRNCKLP